MEIKFSEEDVRFLQAWAVKINGVNSWYNVPSWFKDAGDNKFEIVDSKDVPLRVKEIYFKHIPVEYYPDKDYEVSEGEKLDEFSTYHKKQKLEAIRQDCLEKAFELKQDDPDIDLIKTAQEMFDFLTNK